MNLPVATIDSHALRPDTSIGRIVSVTGSKAIVLLDTSNDGAARPAAHRPEMGTLLAIEQARTVVLAIVSALSVPVPAQREGENEIWIAELGLVGELWKARDGKAGSFNRGVTIYPLLGDRVRVATKAEPARSRAEAETILAIPKSRLFTLRAACPAGSQ